MAFKPFVWSAAYSVNINSIDEQHQKLFAIYNKFGEALVSQNATALIDGVLEELIDYTVYHFDYEEKLFAEHNYENHQAHAQEHDKLKQSVINFQRQYKKGVLESEDMIEFLRDWLKVHILVTDKAYGPCLADKGIK